MIWLFRKAVRLYWLIVPHWLVPQGQFASGVCRRCGRGIEAHL